MDTALLRADLFAPAQPPFAPAGWEYQGTHNDVACFRISACEYGFLLVDPDLFWGPEPTRNPPY